MREIILALIVIVFQPLLYASIPENELEKWDTGRTWNITEQDFWNEIKFVYDIYKPIFNELKVNWWIDADWNSKINNIYAEMKDDQWSKNWRIILHGGLARRMQLSKDGLYLAICHEIGHLVGGFPLQDYTKYSTEGEADYYAAHVCARKIFGAMEKKQKLNSLGVKVDICDKNFDNEFDRNVCYRSVFAAKSLADTIYVANKQTRPPEIDEIDSYVAKVTVQLHSPAQCRLQTFIAGILCDKPWDDKKIPMERNAVCLNSRPKCWYKD